MVEITLVVLASFATLVSSFNTDRTDGGELDGVANNINRWYIVFEDFIQENSSSTSTTTLPTDSSSETVTDPDPLSVIWYLGAFGGLIAFFLVVTFSEWCCASKHLYRRHTLAAPYLTGYSTESRAPDTPPPPYHLFAPPPYAEVICCEKNVPPAPIFIIPVHQQPVAALPPPATPPATVRSLLPANA